MNSRADAGKSVAVAVIVWAALVVVGVRWTLTYESTPGPVGTAPGQWPAASNLTRGNGGFTLVMLAHPDCPCTRASLAELEKILVRTSRRLRAFVLFSKPGTGRDEIQQSELWQRAVAIPGVSAVFDEGGGETRRFRAHVSGHTLLYDAAGRLKFAGGITAVRGQQGDNAGAESVVRLVTGTGEGRTTTPVFGCALHNPDAATLQERGSRWTRR